MHPRLLITISFFTAMLSDVINYMSVSMHISLDATYFVAILKMVSLVCLLYLNRQLKWETKIPGWVRYFFTLLMVWNIVTIIRGAFAAEGYWDWKYLCLVTTFTLLIPYAIIAGVLFMHSQDLFTRMVTKLFVFGYLAIPLTLSLDKDRELFPRQLAISISFFILIIPYVKLKWRLVILAVAAVSVMLAYDFRSNVLRIAFVLLLVMIYYIKKYITTGMLKLACLICILIPPVFLALGITNQYNIFQPADDIEKYAIEYNTGAESNLALDTRTFLYQEVLSSIQATGSFAFGEGATAKYKTEYFDEEIGAGGKGRYGAEVGFLSTLLYSGCLGVILYALILFSAIYYGIRYSNNFFCKMLAVFLAFRWIIFFIEDFIQYDSNYYFLWIAIGLCLSKDFRAMTDGDIKEYFNFSGKSRLVPQLT